MKLTFEFRAQRDRWHVRVVETGFSRDAPNVLTYNVRGEVSSLGDYPHVTGAEAARVVPIYDAATFDPSRLAGAVFWYTNFAHQRLRHGLAHIFDLFDRYDLILELPGYDDIAPDLRRRFEDGLYAMPFVSGYTINGRERRLPWNLLRRS